MRRLISAIALGGLLLASCSGDDSSVEDAAPGTTESDTTESDTTEPTATEPALIEPTTTEPTVTEPETTEPPSPAVGTMVGWQPVLDGVIAGPTPPTRECREMNAFAADEPVPVPSYLEPDAESIEALATFDEFTNSIIVVRRGALSNDGDTVRSTVAGRFDVCSGEWSQMNADFGTAVDAGPSWPDALVYDVDSDALVAFSRNGVHVYNRDADDWSIRPFGAMRFVISATYHPASGRILALTGDGLIAYDVDADRWDLVVDPWNDPFRGEILGIDETLDKIVIAEGVGTSSSLRVTGVTRLVDPVSGEYTELSTPGRPVANIYNGFGREEAVGQAAGTVFVTDHDNGTMCGFDGATMAWDLCIDSPVVDDAPTNSGWAGAWAIVGDPIHHLLVAVPPSGPIHTAPLP